MKLVRYGAPGWEKPGLIDADGRIRSLEGEISDVSGGALAPEAMERLANLDMESLPLVEDGARLGPCVGGVGKIVAVGLNYSDHAKEAGMAIPEEPILFLKANSSLSGPYDDIEIPKNSRETDWEVELGIVIGTRAKYVDESQSLKHVAGYFLANDVSEREFQQRRSGQWDKGKGCDTFCPIGPWLVTPDEIADPQNLDLWLEVNGERHQAGTTATMIFKIPFLISYISHFMTLHPGDLIITGTPPGVGQGLKPPRFLQKGDVVELGGAGLGTQRQAVRAYRG